MDWEKIHGISLARAHTLGFHEEAEDIAQEVVLTWLEYIRENGKRPNQQIKHAVIDQVRKLFGRMNGEERGEKSLSRYRMMRYIDFEKIGPTLYAPVPDEEPDRPKLNLDVLKRREKICFDMIMDGRSTTEIAAELGVTCSMISRMQTSIKAKLRLSLR